MKRKIIISLIIYIGGIALGFVSLFPFAGGVQVSSTFGVFGLAISVIALLYGIIRMNVREEKSGTVITSKLTPLYKFYIPTFIIEILVFNTILLLFNIYPGNDISVFIVIEVMLVLWVLLFLPCIKLWQMSLKDGKIIVTNYFNTDAFKESEIRKVRRFFIFFFKVKLSQTSFIIFPKLSESANLFVVPKSIRLLKNSL